MNGRGPMAHWYTNLVDWHVELVLRCAVLALAMEASGSDTSTCSGGWRVWLVFAQVQDLNQLDTSN